MSIVALREFLCLSPFQSPFPPLADMIVCIVTSGASQVIASGKEPGCQCRRCKRSERHSFDPWLGKIPKGRHGNPFQYSCLENSMDIGAWGTTTVYRVSKSWTRLKRLSMHTCIVTSKKHKEKINFRKYFGALIYSDDCPLRNSYFSIIGSFILTRRS